MKLLSTHMALAAICVMASSAAQAQPLPPPKPGDEQPRGDITRQARPVMPGAGAGTVQGLLPPPKPGDEQPRGDVSRKLQPGVVSRSGPGTQTEDDIYIGRKVQGNATPGTTRARQSDWCEEDCRKAPGTVTPGPAARPLTPQGPLAAPANPQLVRPMVGQDGGTQGRPYVQFNRTAGPTVGQDGGTQGLVAPGPVRPSMALQGLPDNKPSTPQPKTQPGGEQPRGERRQ